MSSWHDVLETVWLHCDEGQQVGCLRGSDVVETETWLKLRDRNFATKAETETWRFETKTRDLTFL